MVKRHWAAHKNAARPAIQNLILGGAWRFGRKPGRGTNGYLGSSGPLSRVLVPHFVVATNLEVTWAITVGQNPRLVLFDVGESG
jgi:hypothetical protein